MAAKPDPERDWKKALDAHANWLVGEVHACASDEVSGFRCAAPVDGRPSVEIQGLDGEWRRYLVRLTEAPVHAPLDPAHLGAMRP